jgi:hypothetical protein
MSVFRFQPISLKPSVFDSNDHPAEKNLCNVGIIFITSWIKGTENERDHRIFTK